MVRQLVASFFCGIAYWQACSMFTTYQKYCLSAKLYITTSNRWLYGIVAGGFRGRMKVPAEDRNKLSLMGLATYVLLLPMVIFWIASFWHPSAQQERVFWSYWGAAVVMVNVLDDCMGAFRSFLRSLKRK